MNLGLRTFSVWLAIIAAETVNGVAREIFISPKVGDATARRISFGIALVLIWAIAYMSASLFKTLSNAGRLFIGIVWASLTFCFEVFVIGTLASISTERIIADYDPRQGGLMGFGMLYLIIAPTMGHLLRGVFDRQQTVK